MHKQEILYLCPEPKEGWLIVAKDYYRNLFSDEKVGIMEFKTTNINDMLGMIDFIACICGDLTIAREDKLKILAWLLCEAFQKYPVFWEIDNNFLISD